jgi:hypothetical protein
VCVVAIDAIALSGSIISILVLGLRATIRRTYVKSSHPNNALPSHT